MEDYLCLICGNRHSFAQKESVSIEEVHNQDFILREKGSGTRAILENLMQKHHVPLHAKWECSSSTLQTMYGRIFAKINKSNAV